MFLEEPAWKEALAVLLPLSASQDASVQRTNNDAFKIVGLLKFTKEFRLCYNLRSLTQKYLEILCIVTFFWKLLYSRIQRKKKIVDLLASTSIFLTRSYFSESGPKPANLQFYSLDSM